MSLAAEGLAQELGVPANYIRIGANALQVVMLWRAAKAARQGCFVAGTRVLTGYGPDGSPITRNIEDLRPGDRVISRSECDPADRLDPRPVLGVSERTVYRLVHVDVADTLGSIEHLQTTAEHPFWVEGRGWTAAKELATGDTLLDDGGGQLFVAAVRIEDRPEGVAVYNLAVDADHTYFAEDGAATRRFAWVHNAERCGVPPHTAPGVGNVRTMNAFVKQLHKQGYLYTGRANDGTGWRYRNATTGEEVRIHPRPTGYSDPVNAEKLLGRFYYRYRTGPDQEWSSAVHLD